MHDQVNETVRVFTSIKKSDYRRMIQEGRKIDYAKMIANETKREDEER